MDRDCVRSRLRIETGMVTVMVTRRVYGKVRKKEIRAQKENSYSGWNRDSYPVSNGRLYSWNISLRGQIFDYKPFHTSRVCV